MTDMDVQKADEKSFFGKKYYFQQLFSVTLNKSLRWIRTRDVLFTIPMP